MRLHIILFCLILLAGSSCSSKLFLKRKYTGGKYFAFKKQKPAVPVEKTEPLAFASGRNAPAEIIQVKGASPANFWDHEDSVYTAVDRNIKSIKNFAAVKEQNYKKKLFTPSSLKRKSPGGCSGLFYVSEKARLAGYSVSIASILIFYPFILGITLAVGLQVLLSVLAGALAAVGIGVAVSAMSEGGVGNVISCVTTILLGLFILAMCVIVFFL